jgi:hypothetical protein
VYSRKVGKKTLTFGHEGVLFKRSFVMYDKETKSLWVHTLGTAVKGKLKGKQLTFLPSVVTTWGRWKQLHPKTTVLTGKSARGRMGAFDLKKDLRRYGLSVGQGKKVKLYPFTLLDEKRVIHDEFDGEKIVLYFDKESVTGVAYKRGKHTFAYKGGKVLDEKGKVWKLLLGKSGKKTLEAIPATPWLIQRWKGFYPKGEVFSAKPKKD